MPDDPSTLADSLSALNLSRAELISQITQSISSTTQEIEIIPPNRFCRNPSFFNDLPDELLQLIHKVESGGPAPERVEYLSRIGEESLVASLRFGNDPQKRRKAIVMGSLAVFHLSKDMPERGIVLSAFGRTLREEWGVSAKREDLDDVIYYFRKTVDVEPPEEANRPLHWHDLGKALHERYKLTKEDADYEDATTALREAIASGHAHVPRFLCDLGKLMYARQEILGITSAEDLDACLEMHRRAVDSITDKAALSGYVGPLYFHLGEIYGKRYQLAHDEADWEQNRRCFEDAVSCAQRWAPNRFLFLCHLGRLLSARFDRFGRLEDGDAAEDYFRQALVEQPGHVMATTDLAVVLRFRAACTGTLRFLEEAITLVDDAVSRTPADDEDLPTRLRSQAHIYAQRAEMMGQVTDIDKAIEICSKAVDCAAARNENGEETLIDLLQSLAEYHLERFKLTELATNVENALSAIERALSNNPSIPHKSQCLRIKGRVYNVFFQLDRNETSLLKAITAFEESIALADPSSSSAYLAHDNLGNAYTFKFERTGHSKDIADAIASYYRAFDSLSRARTTESRSEAEAILHHGLGNAQLKKFERWMQMADIDLAVASYERALNAANDYSPRLAGRTGSLSWALQIRSNATGSVEDLKRALHIVVDALNTPFPLRPSERAYLENRRGAARLRLYLSLNDPSDLDLAAADFRSCIASTCVDPILKNCGAMNLALTLIKKADHTKTLKDVEVAAGQCSSLLQQVKGNDPYAVTLLMHIGDLLHIYYEMRKDKRVGLLLIAVHLSILNSSVTLPGPKIYSQLLVSKLHYDVRQDAKSARDGMIATAKGLQEVTLLWSNRSDQLRNIRMFKWLPCNLLAFSIMAGDTAKDTIVWFERSRGVIWNTLLCQGAGGVEKLEQEKPELAERFKNLRMELAEPSTGKLLYDPSHIVALAREKHLEASLQYNELVREIRACPGFEDFLLPSSDLDMEAIAAEGPIIIVNMSEYRSDAFIVRSSGTFIIPLPEFTDKACYSYAGRFLQAISEIDSEPEKASNEVDEVLTWLWTAAAEPILDALGYTARCSSSSAPRIWWLATAWSTMFPIHAAGNHRRARETGEPCSVLDRVTSSYTSTLGALSYARKMQSEKAARNMATVHAVLVQMPTTPNMKSLPNAAAEISAISTTLTDLDFETSILDTPICADVLQSLRKVNIAHFASHAISDTEDPSLSRIFLRDWKSKSLNVRALLRQKMNTCQLVYLSGCETAANKVHSLREEGISVSGGFQMAGVPHVIATLWRIEDTPSVDIATQFYLGLKEGEGLEVKNSAVALRSALLAARDRNVDALLWGAYIHSGA